LRQAVLEQGEKWRLALSFASPASRASRAYYPSSIAPHPPQRLLRLVINQPTPLNNKVAKILKNKDA